MNAPQPKRAADKPVRLKPSTIELLDNLKRQLAAAANTDATRDDALRVAVLFALDHVPDVAAQLPDRKRAAS